jgi:hypothetical protein
MTVLYTNHLFVDLAENATEPRASERKESKPEEANVWSYRKGVAKALTIQTDTPMPGVSEYRPVRPKQPDRNPVPESPPNQLANHAAERNAQP